MTLGGYLRSGKRFEIKEMPSKIAKINLINWEISFPLDTHQIPSFSRLSENTRKTFDVKS